MCSRKYVEGPVDKVRVDYRNCAKVERKGVIPIRVVMLCHAMWKVDIAIHPEPIHSCRSKRSDSFDHPTGCQIIKDEARVLSWEAIEMAANGSATFEEFPRLAGVAICSADLLVELRQPLLRNDALDEDEALVFDAPRKFFWVDSVSIHPPTSPYLPLRHGLYRIRSP
jgi:hypothetical protein